MQAGVDASTSPRAVSASQATRLHQILHEAKFADPSGSHLSPAGAHRPRLASPAQDRLSLSHCGLCMKTAPQEPCTALARLELASCGLVAAHACPGCGFSGAGGGHVPDACNLAWAAGEYNLRLGITKELHPDMVATYQGTQLRCHAYQAYWRTELCMHLR